MFNSSICGFRTIPNERFSNNCFVCLLISAGTYASYVNLSVSLFLLLHIVRILTTRQENPVQVFWKHLRFLLTFGAAMVATAGIVAFLVKLFGGAPDVFPASEGSV